MINLLDIAQVAEKAAEIAQKDPKGLIISLVAISVVFLSLFVLHYCYRFVGWLSTRKKLHDASAAGAGASRTGAGSRTAEVSEEVAAAISMALAMENGSDEAQAAIALALDCYLSESIHDKESYIITIKRK